MGLSNQGAGADPGRSRQSTEQALLAASALAIPLGAACAAWASSHPQSCSVPESSRSFRLPPYSPRLDQLLRARWSFRRAEVGREALCLQSIEFSSRHREMGRAQPVLFHRAVQGCLQQLLASK